MRLTRTVLVVSLAMSLCLPAAIAGAADNPFLSPGFMVQFQAAMAQISQMQQQMQQLDAQQTATLSQSTLKLAVDQATAAKDSAELQALEQQSQAIASFAQAGTALTRAAQGVSDKRTKLQALIGKQISSLSQEIKTNANPKATGPVAAEQKEYVAAALALLEKELVAESTTAAKTKQQFDGSKVLAQKLLDVSKKPTSGDPSKVQTSSEIAKGQTQKGQLQAQQAQIQTQLTLMQNVSDSSAKSMAAVSAMIQSIDQVTQQIAAARKP